MMKPIRKAWVFWGMMACFSVAVATSVAARNYAAALAWLTTMVVRWGAYTLEYIADVRGDCVNSQDAIIKIQQETIDLMASQMVIGREPDTEPDA